MILQIFGVIFWMVVIPFASGIWVTSLMKEDLRSPWMSLLCGYLVNISLFECLYVVVLEWNANFNLLVPVFQVLIVIVAVLSSVLGRKSVKLFWNKKISVWWILPIVLIVAQMVLRALMRVYDGDDAFFVASALGMEQSGKMGLIDPYTGLETAKDIRHAFAAAPAFIAYLSRVTNIHTTIMAHIVWADTVFLLVYITLTYIAKLLLKDKTEYVPFFMTLVALLNIFGLSSIYMPATFLMTRTWQGKTMFAAWIIPLIYLVLLLLLRNVKEDSNRGIWIFCTLVMLAGTAMTSAAIAMSPCLLAIGMIFLVIREKKPKWLLYTALCSIFNVVIGAVFVLA